MQPNGNMPGVGRPVAGAPVNNINAKPVSTSPPAPKPAGPAFGNGGSVVEGKGDKKTGWILAVVFLLIVTAGGVGLGVWAYMDGNAQKDALNSQISALKRQNSDLQERLDDGGDDIGEEYENPVISSGSEEAYNLYLSSSLYAPTNKVLSITVLNGEVSQCMIGAKVDNGAVYGEAVGGSKCTVDALDEKIYKIVEFGEGQDSSSNYYGFIMEDGTVRYVSLESALGEGNTEISFDKTLNIDGFITDAIDVNVVTAQGGGYGKTVFVLRDGSYVGFDKSMLN